MRLSALAALHRDREQLLHQKWYTMINISFKTGQPIVFFKHTIFFSPIV
jgi:hypothetical protein